MRKLIISALLLTSAALSAAAGNDDVTKTGWNLGPLPAVAFDADNGFQIGGILQFFNYGNGTNYPNYDSKLYLEASFFSKGSKLFQVRYDDKTLIPGIRWSSSLRYNIDKAFDFYGFNGYESNFCHELIDAGAKGEGFLFTPFYRYSNKSLLMRSDLIGELSGNLKWEAGIFAYKHKLSTIDYDNVNKGKTDTEKFPDFLPTLFELYKLSGAISEDEADGGFSSGLRAGLVYDSRDKEGAPTSGIWAEGHISSALPGISTIPYTRYSLTWRHYLPIISDDALTFAYRLNYEGNVGKNAPFYALPYMTVMGEKNDLDGMGGYNTVRGIMRTRVVGLDMATYNAEFRWRFYNTRLLNQNIALGLSAFSDGTMVTRERDLGRLLAYHHSAIGSTVPQKYLLLSNDKHDMPHITFGSGFRFIMNENFIVAAEYGVPVTHFMKNSSHYNQDGNGAFYINLGYLF